MATALFLTVTGANVEEMIPADLNDQFKFVKTRWQRGGPFPEAMVTKLPVTPDEYRAQLPAGVWADMYPDEQPAPCPLDIVRLKLLAASTPMRSTSSSLARQPQLRLQPTPAQEPVQQLASMMMQAMMGNMSMASRGGGGGGGSGGGSGLPWLKLLNIPGASADAASTGDAAVSHPRLALPGPRAAEVQEGALVAAEERQLGAPSRSVPPPESPSAASSVAIVPLFSTHAVPHEAVGSPLDLAAAADHDGQRARHDASTAAASAHHVSEAAPAGLQLTSDK